MTRLRKRVDELERRVAALEAERTVPTAATTEVARALVDVMNKNLGARVQRRVDPPRFGSVSRA